MAYYLKMLTQSTIIITITVIRSAYKEKVANKDLFLRKCFIVGLLFPRGCSGEGERAVLAFLEPEAYLSYQEKVLRLNKQALRHLESWCIHRDKQQYFACLMRA